MKPTDQTLMQQMQISLADIERRKQLLGLIESELLGLARVRSLIEPQLEHMIAEFYDFQTSVPEINSLIGDADTLSRLKVAQHQYILDLFSGCFDSAIRSLWCLLISMTLKSSMMNMDTYMVIMSFRQLQNH